MSATEFVDEGELAGYVDSGIWELELWLAARAPKGLDRLWRHMQLLTADDDD